MATGKKILNKIKETRICRGLSARKLALLSGLSVTSICNLEAGNMPSMKNLAKIINALDLQINGESFKDLLTAKRKLLNITLEKIARMSGVSHTLIHKAEHGVMPSTKSCLTIAKDLNIPLEQLIDWPSNK